MLSNLFAQSADASRAPLPAIWWLGPIAAILALAFAWIFYRQVMRKSEGTDRMIEIAQDYHELTGRHLSILGEIGELYAEGDPRLRDDLWGLLSDVRMKLDPTSSEKYPGTSAFSATNLPAMMVGT